MMIRSLFEGEQDACLDLWDAAFERTPRTYFEKYFQDPHWSLGDTVVCEEAGRLVSAVHLVRRVVETREGRRNMAGIANVGTHPDFRGGGRSTACLTETIRRMEADPSLDFSLLGTGIPEFYARLGWSAWKFRYWEGGNPFLGRQYLRWQSRPATVSDLPRIASWHAAQNRDQPLAVVREPDYWRDWMHWTPEEYLVCEEGYAQTREVTGVCVVAARTEGFPWHEAFGTAQRIHLCLPLSEDEARQLLVDPTSLSRSRGRLMIRPLQNKALPDLTDACFYDGDGF